MIKKTFIFVSMMLVVVCVLFPQGTQKDFRDLKGPFMGQTAPKKKSVVFVDRLISTIDQPEMCAAFSKDGNQFYYNALHRGDWAIFVTRNTGDGWSKPTPLPFSGGYTDRDFTMSPDGNRIYFGSNRPRKKDGPKQSGLDIFVTQRSSAGKWSYPKSVGPPINTDHGENYPCQTANGNLYYFTCRPDEIGGCDLYVAPWGKTGYQTPRPLPRTINSDKNDWDAYIEPNEKYIIFSSQNRADTIGGQDLYISFKKSDGTWTQAKNMGPAVNSTGGEICPSVSLDGKYFFFTSRRRGKADIFWMTTDIIEKLKQ